MTKYSNVLYLSRKGAEKLRYINSVRVPTSLVQLDCTWYVPKKIKWYL